MKSLLANAETAAKNLLGWQLVHDSPAGRTVGYIVETEAYTMTDPASHAYRGQSTRNTPMFERAGTIYVYFTYGMHYCMNIVTGEPGHGQAVLIRALQPSEGIELMEQRRGLSKLESLCSGPAKLTQAMGINTGLSGSHIEQGPISLLPGIVPVKIVQTTRIGISQATDKPWRFYIANNPFISRK